MEYLVKSVKSEVAPLSHMPIIATDLHVQFSQMYSASPKTKTGVSFSSRVSK